MAGRKRSRKTNGEAHDETENAPVTETAADVFRRLGNARVAKAMKAIQLCGNLANYPHTDEQYDTLMAALGKAIDGVETAFAAKRKEATPAQVNLF